MDSTKKPESQKEKIKKLANKMTKTKHSLLDFQYLENRVKNKTIQFLKTKKNSEYVLYWTKDTLSAYVLSLDIEMSFAMNFKN